MQAYGNADVVAMLEHWLADAKRGRMNFVCLVACDDHPKTWGTFAGAAHMVNGAKPGLEALMVEIDKAIRNPQDPDPDPSLGWDYACYNIASGAPSYDFISWLVDAEMARVRHRSPAPLKVGFFMGHHGHSGLHVPYRKQMFENVVRPALALIGAVEDDRAIHGRTSLRHTVGNIVEASRAGEHVPLLWAPPNTPHPTGVRNTVTITLRESDITPHRNSNLAAWLRFASWLKKRGYSVVFVRDTARVMEAMPNGWPDCPMASIDLHARMKLYQSARANLFVSNGPSMLAIFSLQPWLNFTQMQPDGHAYKPDTPSFWRENMGMEEGDQFPWSRPDQRMVWKPDTYENIVQAWKTYIEGADYALGIASAGGIHGHVAHRSGPPQTQGARQETRTG